MGHQWVINNSNPYPFNFWTTYPVSIDHYVQQHRTFFEHFFNMKSMRGIVMFEVGREYKTG